jgi:phospholipase C
MSGKKHDHSGISRRRALRNLGLSLSALTVGCVGGGSDVGPQLTDEDPDLGGDPPDLGSPADLSEVLPSTPKDLLAGIDAVVVLMMENRSFDHYLGTLSQDARYPGARRPSGLTGKESNPDGNGKLISVAKLLNYEPKDPPHGWDACHSQFGGGKNDGFVKEYIARHGDKYGPDVMGFYDRSQLPYYYALADHFTVCDHWFASVMGPTWPNRFYLHAGSSGGKKDNTPFATGGPTTLWERLKQRGLVGKNYIAGPAAWYWGAYPGKLLSVNPTAKLDDFFKDCKAGTLPPFSIIDPDFLTNDDHPSHNVQLGQALIATLISAVMQSPQWSRTLFVLTYDEHGGFYDHVAPPKLPDDNAEFTQVGFRVPTLLIGPTVRQGFVDSTVYDHTSVGATLRTRFGIDTPTKRMAAAADLSAAMDPKLVKHPAPPPADLPRLSIRPSDLSWGLGADSQPELTAALREMSPSLTRSLRELVGPANHLERTLSWLRHGEQLGAVEILD